MHIQKTSAPKHVQDPIKIFLDIEKNVSPQKNSKTPGIT